MTIASIRQTVTVKAPPARAFDIFTGKMGLWWKPGTTMGKSPHKDMIIEPRVGGRWYEVDANNTEIQWGNVLAWQPPSRLLLAWQINGQFKYDPNFVTELEMTFAQAGDGTLVTLEHRNLERFGDQAEKFTSMLTAGWASHMEELAAFVNDQS